MVTSESSNHVGKSRCRCAAQPVNYRRTLEVVVRNTEDGLSQEGQRSRKVIIRLFNKFGISAAEGYLPTFGGEFLGTVPIDSFGFVEKEFLSLQATSRTPHGATAVLLILWELYLRFVIHPKETTDHGQDRTCDYRQKGQGAAANEVQKLYVSTGDRLPPSEFKADTSK